MQFAAGATNQNRFNPDFIASRKINLFAGDVPTCRILP